MKQLLVLPRSPSPEPERVLFEEVVNQALQGEKHHQPPDPAPVQVKKQDPSQAPVNDDEEDYTPEEREAMAEALKRSRSGKKNFKREREDEVVAKQELHEGSNIKREHLGAVDRGVVHRPKKAKKWTRKTIVDLTEDEPEIFVIDD